MVPADIDRAGQGAVADATNDGGTETIKAAVIKAGARQRAFSNANRPAPIIESQVATDIFSGVKPSFPKRVSKKIPAVGNAAALPQFQFAGRFFKSASADGEPAAAALVK